MTQKQQAFRGMAGLLVIFSFLLLFLSLWEKSILPGMREDYRRKTVGSSGETHVAREGDRLLLPLAGNGVWLAKVRVNDDGYIILVSIHPERGSMDRRIFSFPFMRDYMEIDLHGAWGLPFKLAILRAQGNSIEYAVLDRASL